MKFAKSIIAIIVLSVAFSAARAAEKAGLAPGRAPFSYMHLDVKDGLTNNFVADIVQDCRGFMWIATDAGLSRFDGENFKTFNERNSSIRGNSVYTLFYDDHTDKLWVGTKSGLSILDCASQTFAEITIPEGMRIFNVTGFSRAGDGGVWIANHYDNVVHFDTSRGTWTPIGPKTHPDLPNDFRCILDDGSGHLYLGHTFSGMSIVDLATGAVRRFEFDPDDPKGLPGADVNTIHIDRNRNVWIGTDRGLALFNPVTGEFTAFRHDKSNPNSIVGDFIYDIREMDDSSLWIASDIGGVSILDLRNLTFADPERLKFHSLPVTYVSDGLSSPNIRSVFQDTYGNIWIGNFSEGLDVVSRVRHPFKILPYNLPGTYRNRPIRSVMADRGGRIWLGADNEILLLRDGRIERVYDLAPYFSKQLASVIAMIRDGDCLIFSAFNEGIMRLHPESGVVERIDVNQSFNYANNFYRAPDGRIYMAAQDGLYYMENGRVDKWQSLSSTFYNLIPNGIAYDKEGKLWIGTYGNGVYVFDRDEKVVALLRSEDGFSSNATSEIFTDSQQRLWIAGHDGLSLIRDTSRPTEYENYSYNSGLSDIHIRSIREDSEGNIWFSTNNGLTCLLKDSGKFENYDYRSGLPQGNFLERAADFDPETGLMYFGSLSGLCYFNPAERPMTGEKIPVRIVECRTINFNDEDNTSASGIIPLPASKTEIHLPYEANSLNIVFAVPDFSLSPLAEYAYMVEGLDENWMVTGNERQATLRNLPPGSYTFKVKARIRNQEWDESGMACMKVIVSPPVWMAWYAWLLYLVIAVAAIVALIRFYNHKILLKNKLEFERRKSIDEQELNNERLRFYTNITHELRTPLTLILGPLEDIVSDPSLPEAFRGKIKTIHNSTLRMLSLINQILEFRKTETQNRKLTVAKSNLGNLVTEIGLRYKELNRNDKVDIILDVDTGNTEVYYDPEVITTILNNLLSNAMKYTPSGRITLSLKRLSEDGKDWVEIDVSDTGYGIDAKSLPHIFDRYYQAQGKHQASGTGIGLALVQSLSELHHGMMSVTSEVGKGTTFKFRLLADNTYPEAQHTGEPLEEQVPEETEDVESTDSRATVLVVEDNDDISEYIESSLQSKYRVIRASNGKEGLEAAHGNMPDIIISDIMMPEMDGIELCERIKENFATSHIPVVLLTAKDSIQDKEAGYEAGADSYLTKPFSARLLISRIHNILESRRLLVRNIGSTDISTAEPSENGGDGSGTSSDDWAAPLKLSRLDEEFLDRFAAVVIANITMPTLDMTFMQRSLHMSHSTLYRKIKGLTGMSGSELIRKIKLRRGAELLREGCNVSETAYSCGFNDANYFRSVFKEEFGISPSQFVKNQAEKK